MTSNLCRDLSTNKYWHLRQLNDFVEMNCKVSSSRQSTKMIWRKFELNWRNAMQTATPWQTLEAVITLSQPLPLHLELNNWVTMRVTWSITIHSMLCPQQRSWKKPSDQMIIIACLFDGYWWVLLVEEVNIENRDVTCKFMYPHGPTQNNNYHWPPREDNAWVPFGKFIMKIDPPPSCTSNSGRQFQINGNQFAHINNIFKNTWDTSFTLFVEESSSSVYSFWAVRFSDSHSKRN